MTGGRDRSRVERGAALRSIVGPVVAEAVRSAAAGGVVVLDDWTPEGELAYEWLVGSLGEGRVWRGASVASNVHGTGMDRADAQLLGSDRMVRDRAGLIAHPASKTVLLLGGALPRADLFPLGDLYASQIVQLAGGWSAPEELRDLAGLAGGLEALDAALSGLVDGRDRAALDALPGAAAERLLHLYERGRHYRMRPRIVPKLTARTIGVDLFD